MPIERWGLLLRAVPVLLVLLLLPSGVATAQNDAGSGGDAPGEAWNAVPLSLGKHIGVLDPPAGDTEDWYRVEVPAGMALRFVVFDPGNYVSQSAYDANGGGYYGWTYNYAFRTATLVLVPPTPTMYLKMSEYSGYPATYYEVLVEFLPTADLVVSIDEVREPTPGEEGLVTITVRNDGDVAAIPSVTASVIHGSQTRAFEVDPLNALAPGSAVTIDLTWDGLGEFGEGKLVVSATTALERDPSDNSADEDIVVGIGVGAGFDLLNRWQVVSADAPVLWRQSAGFAQTYSAGSTGSTGAFVDTETYAALTLYYGLAFGVKPCATLGVAFSTTCVTVGP